jgi:hypothetical protein
MWDLNIEFKDVNFELYDALFHEYSLTPFFKKGRWDHFVYYKDMGVKYIQTSVYEVVDEKKWMLAKIKYGI